MQLDNWPSNQNNLILMPDYVQYIVVIKICVPLVEISSQNLATNQNSLSFANFFIVQQYATCPVQ